MRNVGFSNLTRFARDFLSSGKKSEDRRQPETSHALSARAPPPSSGTLRPRNAALPPPRQPSPPTGAPDGPAWLHVAAVDLLHDDVALRNAVLAEKRRSGWTEARHPVERIAHRAAALVRLRTDEVKARRFTEFVANSPLAQPLPARWERRGNAEHGTLDIRRNGVGGIVDVRPVLSGGATQKADLSGAQADGRPTIGQLVAAGQERFAALGGLDLQAAVARNAALGVKDPVQIEALNRLGAQVSYDVVRAYFKQAMKSSNKTYEVREDTGLKAWQGALRHSRAAPTLNGHQIRRDGLETTVARGVANCAEMALLSTAIARGLGLPADAWGYAVGGALPHEFCIVGQVSARHDGSSPMRQHERRGDSNAPHLWVVDPWAGVCCTAMEFDARFEAKMTKWAQDGKLIRVGTQPWIRPDDPQWLQITSRSPQGKLRSLLHPLDPQYRAEVGSPTGLPALRPPAPAAPYSLFDELADEKGYEWLRERKGG